MSTIYAFQESESVISSTTTTAISGSDALPLYSASAGRTKQATVGSISCMAAVTTATSATTATPISNSGYTSLGSSSGPNTTWTIAAPVAGALKTIWNTSTSTAAIVNSGSTGITFNSTGSNSLVLNSSLAYVDLVGLSATAWRITAMSTALTALTTF